MVHSVCECVLALHPFFFFFFRWSCPTSLLPRWARSERGTYLPRHLKPMCAMLLTLLDCSLAPLATGFTLFRWVLFDWALFLTSSLPVRLASPVCLTLSRCYYAHICSLQMVCVLKTTTKHIFLCVLSKPAAFRRGKLASRLANHVILFFMPGQTFYLNYESKVRAHFFNEFIAFN